MSLLESLVDQSSECVPSSELLMDPASHLDDYLLATILEADPDCVPDALLVQLRGMGRRLRSAADATLLSRFLSRWQLAGVGVPPPSPTAYLASLRHFTARQTVAARDTLSALAVRHGTDTGTLRRLNNIISDHTLASRTEIFVPIRSKECVVGCVVDFHSLTAAHGRPVWVVRPLEEGDDLEELTKIKQRSQNGAAAATAEPSARLQELMRRALGCDAPTARFYLTAAGGDLRRAMSAYHEDQRWERSMKGLKKALRKAAKRRPSVC